jgi:hypothetical protein
MVPGIGAEFAADMDMMRMTPAATIEFGQFLAKGPKTNINPCSTRYGNSEKTTAQYDVIISNYI